MRSGSVQNEKNAGDIARIPIIVDEGKIKAVHGVVESSIQICKDNWDSFETSWDCQHHPIVWLSRDFWDATAIAASMQAFYGELPKVGCPLEICYLLWQGICSQRFNQLKTNEEETQPHLHHIYGLKDELTRDVGD